MIEDTPNEKTCRGGRGDHATTIDLTKPGDVALLHRALSNGWDVPQNIRDQICEQLIPAMDAARARQTTRGGRQLIRLVMLAVKMEARNRLDAGYSKSLFPYLRRRHPEKRQRRRPRDRAADLQSLETILAHYRS